jgi:multidrug efflux pump subunit AcrB
MKLLALSHKNPIATIVLFLILCLLGVAALPRMPVQLVPDIERPKISILNFWRAAAPAEMEAELVEPQEYVLKNLTGVEEMRSSVRAGLSITELTFSLGTDMQEAFINVVNALNQTPPRPREADEPMVSLGGLQDGFATMLIKKTGTGENADFTAYQDLIERSVAPQLRTIEGISGVELNSLLERELQITFDPYRMAALGISLNTVINAIRHSSDVSGGFAEVGRREYTVRFRGQYHPHNYAEMIVAHNNGRPVYLSEIADVNIDFQKQRNFAYRDGKPAFFLQVYAANNANTVAIMDELKQRIATLNEQVLKPAGLEMVLSFDPSEHIRRAIDLVKSSLGLGIVLAMALLYVMLRGARATLLIGMTIPVSLLTALLVLDLLGRSLNIISLAGLAFATGLVLDAAIVVQENIVRLLQQGQNIRQAAIRATAEVSPALFASTLTTVAIFTPVLFMLGIEGQLFFDLAISMAVSVTASMFSALFLLPVLTVLLLKSADNHAAPPAFWSGLAKRYWKLTNSTTRCALWLLLLVPGAIAVILFMTPRADFLPEAKWEGIMAVFNVPPGANIQVLEKELGQTVVKRLQPYLDGEKQPALRGYNIAMSSGGHILFVYPQHASEVDQVLSLLREDILTNLPDTQAFAFQSSLLGLTSGSSRNLYLNFNGELDAASRLVARNTYQQILDTLPGAVVRPLPGFNDSQPELMLYPDNAGMAEAGLQRSDVASMIRALTSGVYAGEYFNGNQRMDIILKAPQWQTPEHLRALPMASANGEVFTLEQLTTMERGVGPTRLRRYNGERALTLAITPPDQMSLDEAIDRINAIADQAREQVGEGVFLSLSGGSDQLAETIDTMSKNFISALLILFLLMMALFRSARDSLMVLLSMPMALAGGVLALQFLNLFVFQALDLLTMIGFLILLGLVVNNAILLVDKTRQAQQQGIALPEAIQRAISTRVRPIYMSTLTSVVGMLPLVLIPGTGSEIYRGLAAVIVGGMTLSTLFMVIFMSSALRLLSPAVNRTQTGPVPHFSHD